MRQYTESVIENAYGPTETTIWSSKNIIRDDDIIEVSIGKPITNTQIYILNGNSLCGIGIPGELCIAGDGVAIEYLNREELIKEKFVNNPYGRGKLYRSGDIAKWLPDGRIDDQVKIRGYRIELGEIESVLKQIKGIKGAAVEVREALEQQLPEYMIPSYIMQIEHLPLTASGKLNYRELPVIEKKSERKYVAPSNEMEKLICRVFSQVLEIETIGVEDNFFEFGGDLVKAMRFSAQMKKSGIEFSVINIFQYRTVKRMALENFKDQLQEVLCTGNLLVEQSSVKKKKSVIENSEARIGMSEFIVSASECREFVSKYKEVILYTGLIPISKSVKEKIELYPIETAAKIMDCILRNKTLNNGDKLPMLILENGRNENNSIDVDLCVRIKPIFYHNEECLHNNNQLIESVFFNEDDMPLEELNKLKTLINYVPVINYGGIFDGDNFDIKKEYEKTEKRELKNYRSNIYIRFRCVCDNIFVNIAYPKIEDEVNIKELIQNLLTE